jgi:undecaprenyl-diphosphatase
VRISAVAVIVAALAWRRGGIGGAAPLLMFVAVGIEVALKMIVPQPAPESALSRDLNLFSGPTLDAPFGFPSGHELRTTFLATMATPPRDRWIVASVALVVLMGVTRVYLAQHWPSDVLGGLLLGLVFGLLARRAYLRAWRR